MDNQLINSLTAEALKLRSFDSDSLIDWDFKKQSDFLTDPARLKACLCTRRAGKSYGAGTIMFKTGFDKPGASILYVALTRDSAKRIMWKDVIKVIDRKYKLGCSFNETLLTATLPNGSVLYLTGADAKPDEMEKLLGQKYPLVVIDEAASWKQDMRKLVYGVLKPAVADYRGTIMMIGTPGNLVKSFYHNVTDGIEPGWSVHKWNTFDNPHMATQWKAEIDELIAQNPAIEHTPLFKQMYRGEWFVDQDKLCYRFNEDRDVVDALPDQDYNYVLGVDLGYDPDPSAFVLCAYAAHDPNLYIIEAWQQTKMIISDVATRIRHYVRQVNGRPIRIVIDASAKQAVEEMRQREGLPLEAAEKTGKAGFIDIMSSDMIMGKVKVLRACSEPIVGDWAALVWDEDAAKRQENPACANHLPDAALYAWRWAYNYAWSKRPDPRPAPTSERAVDEFWEKEGREAKRKKATPFWMK